MKIKMAVAALGLAMAVSAPAQAQVPSGPSCSGATFGSYSFQNCWFEPVAGLNGNDWGANNPTRQQQIATFLDGAEPLGATWSPTEKVDAGQSGRFSFTGANTGAGTLSFGSTALPAGWFALSFKQQNTFALYTFYEASDVSSIVFDITGIDPNSNDWRGISHVSLWQGTRCEENCNVDPFSVPEPSSFAMMFAGLLGLGVAARRRRNA